MEKHPRSQLVNNAALELAEVEFENGGPQGGVVAAERLEKLLDRKIDPQLRQLTLYRLGIVQFDLKAYGDSAKAFEELLKDVPKNLEVSAAWQAGEARREVARAVNGEAKTQGLRAALVNYQTAAEAGSAGGNDGELQLQALLRIGEMHASLEDWEASQKSYEKFITGNPNDKLIRTAHLGYGWSLHNQEKYDEAVASYTKTVKDGVRDDTGAGHNSSSVNAFWSRINTSRHVRNSPRWISSMPFRNGNPRAYLKWPAPLRRRNKSMKPGRCSTSSLKNILKRLLPGRLRKSSTG